MTTNDLAWLVGGAQGTGVDSSANVFGRACAYGGLYVFGRREFYSNIMGEHSYFQVRAASRPVRSHADPVNLLATFDAETVFRHAHETTNDGGIVYDPDVATTTIADVPTMEARYKQDLRAYLLARDLGETVADALEAAKQRGVQILPVPMSDLLKAVADKYQVTQLGMISRMVNMFAVGTSFGLLEYPFEPIEKAIRYVFRAKASVAEMNVFGARLAYDHTHERHSGAFPHRLKPMPASERRVFLTGSQAVALGKMVGGCRFQSYYPITPATDESEFMEANPTLSARAGGDAPESEEAGILGGDHNTLAVVQTEDEIAAVTMATGAALAGVRSATSTSGPGFSLMMEGIGWASINEVPVVITLYQRAGPSTGIPTRNEQADLRFAIHAGHGETPRIVFTSADTEECFYDAVKALNYADRYQMPVIHLVDKALANSTQTVPRFAADRVAIDRGLLAHPGDDEYRRFEFTANGISPRAVVGMPGRIFWNTGDEHDELGHITEDPVLRIRMMEKRMGKLDLAAKEIPAEDQVVFHGDRDAETVVVAWGSTKGALLDALEALRREGYKLGFLQVRLLHPFPSPLVAEALRGRKNIVDVEGNFTAMLGGLIREHTGIPVTHTVVKFTGRPLSCTEVHDALKAVLDGKAPKRQVMRSGA